MQNSGACATVLLRFVDGAEAPTPKGRFIDEGEVPFEFELVQQAIDIFIQ